MNFVEEITPGGFLLKIHFDKWKFLAFDKRGKPVYMDPEGKSLLHDVLLIIFVGQKFNIIRDHGKEYVLLKIRRGELIIPYIDLSGKNYKYIFIQYDKKLDIIPARFMIVDKIQTMVKEIDISTRPDYVIVDDTVSSNDIIIIKSRYKVEEVIHSELANNLHVAQKRKKSDSGSEINLNMLSENPVFLAGIHLRNMDLSKLNQLILDFDMTALDTEYILFFIDQYLEKASSDEIYSRHEKTLLELKDFYEFYLHLLQRSDEDIRRMINSHDTIQKLVPYKTLVSKVKSIYPGREDQIQFSEYEHMILERREMIEKQEGKVS